MTLICRLQIRHLLVVLFPRQKPFIMEQKNIGTVIKEIRLRSGFSQVDLADISGLSLRSIQRIENNNTIPRGDSLKRIAGALNVNIEELTGSLELKNTKLL